jgi:glycosyltransferase involved in cell wall biosynthesis
VRVLYFGTYSTAEGYPRNRVLIEGLRRSGIEVVTCHEEFWADAADKISGATAGRPTTALRYLGAWWRLARRYLKAPDHDVVVVGYTGQVDIFLARLLNLLRGRPVVLDAFLSLHDTLVADRGLVAERGVLAALLRWLDSTSCRLADLVLLDTDAHIHHFERATGLPRRRFTRLFVGEDDREFRPAPPPPPTDDLRVLWFGTYVPLQGVDVVLGAAERLAGEGVRFRMVGRGQQLDEFRERAERLDRVTLLPRWISSEELVAEIAVSDVSLGIFGTTGKAMRVIPCKVYDALAVGRAVVTADTPGARELLADGRDSLLVPPGDPDALARAIRRLAGDHDLRRRIAAGGHETFRTRASPDALGREFGDLLRALVRKP